MTEPSCANCGMPFSQHGGVQATCREKSELLAKLAAAERDRDGLKAAMSRKRCIAIAAAIHWRLEDIEGEAMVDGQRQQSAESYDSTFAELLGGELHKLLNSTVAPE